MTAPQVLHRGFCAATGFPNTDSITGVWRRPDGVTNEVPAAGEEMFILLIHDAAMSITASPLTGWTHLAPIPSATGGSLPYAWALYHKTSTGSEPNPMTWNMSSVGQKLGKALLVSMSNPGGAWDVGAVTWGSGNTITGAAVTAAIDDLVAGLYMADFHGGGGTVGPINPDASMTTYFSETSGTAGTGLIGTIGAKVISGTGSTGNLNGTHVGGATVVDNVGVLIHIAGKRRSGWSVGSIRIA